MDAAARRARVAAVFDRAADTYDTLGIAWFGPIAQGLLQEAAPVAGERVVDIGCGRGAVLLRLLEVLGPRGGVTGLDLAARMVEATGRDVAAWQARHPDGPAVNLVVGDAAAPPLPDAAADAVLASLVLFFLPDPASAVREWSRLLVPGGRLAVSTFGAQDPGWRAVDEVFEPYLPQQLLDARASGTSGPFADDAGMEDLLAGAGLTAVRTATRQVTAYFDDAEHWRAWTWSHGQRVMWEAVPEDSRGEVMAEAARRLEGCRNEDDRIALGQQVRYTLGVRPL